MAFFGGYKLVLVAVIAVAVAVIARNWSCREERERRPLIDRSITMHGRCTAVLSGNRIEVEVERRRLLGEIEEGTPDDPLSPEAFAELQASLRGPREFRLSGISVEDSATLHGEAAVSLLSRLVFGKPVSIDLDSRRDTEGVVWADNGACCQVELLGAGLAKLSGVYPPEWAVAEKLAKKNELGIWGE